MTPLFGYGTFRRTTWRAAILGAEYPVQPATIRGYRRIALPSGYLSLRETVAELAPVDGVLIALDGVGWQIADAWEEVPRRPDSAGYHRVDVSVNTMNGPVAASTYLWTGDARATAQLAAAATVDDDRFALISDRAVEMSIENFGPSMRALRRAAGG